MFAVLSSFSMISRAFGDAVSVIETTLKSEIQTQSYPALCNSEVKEKPPDYFKVPQCNAIFAQSNTFFHNFFLAACEGRVFYLMMNVGSRGEIIGSSYLSSKQFLIATSIIIGRRVNAKDCA